jgi:site-specific DNA-methyltransferase (adenine-specific)
VAENVLKWGVGGINIDGSRVEGTYDNSGRDTRTEDWHDESQVADKKVGMKTRADSNSQGRFPANLIHDGSDEVVGLFPNTKSGSMNGTYKNTMMKGTTGERDGKEIHLQQQASEGSASRFFYCAKASKSERNR